MRSTDSLVKIGKWSDGDRRSLDILSVKKEARLSARALAEVQVNRGTV